MTESAKADLLELTQVYSQYYASTAIRKYDTILSRIARLADFPYMCEAFQAYPKYRRLVADDYLVFYTVDSQNEIVSIHRILYAKRDIWNFHDW